VLFRQPGGFTRNIGGAISNVLYASTDCSGAPLIREQFGAIAAGAATPLLDGAVEQPCPDRANRIPATSVHGWRRRHCARDVLLDRERDAERSSCRSRRLVGARREPAVPGGARESARRNRCTVWLAIAVDAHAVRCRAKKGGSLFAREDRRKNETPCRGAARRAGRW
jgi:hypothetical protein